MPLLALWQFCQLTLNLGGAIRTFMRGSKGLDAFSLLGKLLRRPKITLLLQGQPVAGRSAQRF